MVEVGQLRRWCHSELDGVGRHFVVLQPHTISRREPAAWTEPGWYILIDGRQHWVAEFDIENDSDLLGERVERDSPVASDA
jgi:hypothetical protein